VIWVRLVKFGFKEKAVYSFQNQRVEETSMTTRLHPRQHFPKEALQLKGFGGGPLRGKDPLR
jgi:hypothetical protein